MYGLTPQQARLLRFIRSAEEVGAATPSYAEMAVAIGAKSKTTVCWLVEELERRGAIMRLPYKRRSIMTVPLPEPPPVTPETGDVCALIAEAKKYGNTEDPHDTNRILAEWLWHAIRGTAPDFRKGKAG
jgi:SOS-response transcriptional repressor LexA